MFEDEVLQKSREMEQIWEEQVKKQRGEVPKYRSRSGLEVKPAYAPTDAAACRFENIGMPGQYPLTRGLYPLGYQVQPWMTQQVLGYGLPEQTRERFDRMVAEGMEGYFGNPVMNVVFDNPTKGGVDADRPEAHGHVGVGGMTFSSMQDLEILLDGLPLDKMNVSMITGDTCLVALACYIVLAEKRGFPRAKLRGNSMNWLLKGFHVDNPGFPPEAALYLSTELIEFCSREMPYWNTHNFSGYNIREAGCTAVQELAYMLAWGKAIIEGSLARGLQIDEFAPRLGFQVAVHMDFFEEIAKVRALRRMWARMLREDYGARDPRSWQARMHMHTCGDALVAQQPLNNIARASIQSLAGVLAGTNSLHTSAYDEAIAIPTDDSARLALRTQQIILYETNVPNVTDPLAGSYYVESLTDQIEAKAYELLRDIDTRGGFVKCLETGYLRQEINRAAYEFHEKVRKGEQIIVGVNKHQLEEDVQFEFFRLDPWVEEKAAQRLKELKASRDNEAVKRSLDRVREAAEKRQPLVLPIMEAVGNYATQGEVMDILKGVFGWGFVA